MRLAALARLARMPVIALGGVGPEKWSRLAGLVYGWAAIDGLSQDR